MIMAGYKFSSSFEDRLKIQELLDNQRRGPDHDAAYRLIEDLAKEELPSDRARSREGELLDKYVKQAKGLIGK
jgi:hypothetical protein